jgi:hypothetical protein
MDSDLQQLFLKLQAIGSTNVRELLYDPPAMIHLPIQVGGLPET